MPENKKVLITGASGFLGTYVFKKISEKQEDIYTLGRNPIGANHISADFQNLTFELPNTPFTKVIHLAGKAHVYPKNEAEKEAFNQINYKATIHLLHQLEKTKTFPEIFIFASTAAVYGVDTGTLISESQVKTPTTPYGLSKWNAEKAIISWCDSHQVKYAILRLPLIAGTNAPGNLGSIKNAINKGYYFSIKKNIAKKSIVLATDIANLIADYSWTKSGIYNLTDGVHPTFNQVEQAIEKALGKKIKLNLSLNLVKFIALFGDFLVKIKLPSPLNSSVVKKMTSSLTFNDDKARKELGWNPNPVLPFIEKYI